MNKNRIKRLNRDLIIGWTMIVAVLFIFYCIEIIKGNREVSYVATFLAVTIIPQVLCALAYRKWPDSIKLRYFIVAGYLCMYTFAMFTANTSYVFVYILPILTFLTIYHQLSLIIYTGILSLAINIGSTLMHYSEGMISSSNMKDVEIQYAAIILCFVGAGFTAVIAGDIAKKNQDYMGRLDEKTQQIQRMTLQTIETIANTIDAKDDYTRGHSRRVAEYSAEIAKEMGFPEEKIENVRYIALLHDIGKIGVPDAVLNKPGRLSDAEYELMKTHTTIGADILKDIGMLPDLDVGAKYHHERFDGKGYPSGLKGKEIPEIARIICMADSFDAMTSNRVYRKHLTQDVVMDEIRRCRGVQFDPEITDAFLRYLSRQKTTLADEEMQDEEMEPGNKLLKKIMEDQNKQLIENAEKDQLTKVYNRSAGERYITIAFRDTTGYLFLLNLDDMRRINRQSGFRRGDYYLMRMVDILQSIEGDIIISRFGGDEFLCYVPGLTDEDHISGVMDELMHKIRTCALNEPMDFGLSASAGISIHDNVNQEFTQILNEAEKALYYKKQTGKNGCYFYHQVADREDDITKRELNNLVTALRETDNFSDSMILEENDFLRIYEFIKDVTKGKTENVALLMFTANPVENKLLPIEDRDMAMDVLEKAILKNVNGDENAICYYSSVQRIVIFVNEKEADLKKTASEVLKRFYQVYGKKNIELAYQIADMKE